MPVWVPFWVPDEVPDDLVVVSFANRAMSWLIMASVCAWNVFLLLFSPCAIPCACE